ncbi:MAG TPA: hypothetical protein VEW28_03095 [Candidatus Kapabacteria bacterium]|nr:hypothetical protein [Candidatus Kapabacteria bacterium]
MSASSDPERNTALYVFFAFTIFLLSTRCFAQTDSLSILHRDPNLFRLFLAPTSETLPANHGTFQLAELSVPAINYGIIDELTARIGITPFSISGHNLYYALFGLQVFNYSGFSGVGGFALTNATGSYRNWEGSVYGFGVIGYTTNSYGIYGGFGGGYSSTRESNSAIFMLGGEYAISAHNKLITENWFVSESGSNAFSIGDRIYGNVLSFDLAVVAFTESHSMKITTVEPWVSLSYHFDLSEE